MDQVADRLEVLELFSRYAFALDAVDPDALAECFSKDALWVSEFHGTFRGREAIRELNQRRKEKMATGPNMYRRHYLINPIVELNGDRGTFRAYMLGTQIHGKEIKVELTGHYRGTVVKEDGKWRLAERYAIPDSTETGWG